MIAAQLKVSGFFFFFQTNDEYLPLLVLVLGPESRIMPEASWSCGSPCRGSAKSQSYQRQQQQKNVTVVSWHQGRIWLICLIYLNLLPFPDGGISWKADFMFSWWLPSSLPASLWTHLPLLPFIICKYDVAGANTTLRVLQMSTNREGKKTHFLPRSPIAAAAVQAPEHQGLDVSAVESSYLFCFSCPTKPHIGLRWRSSMTQGVKSVLQLNLGTY